MILWLALAPTLLAQDAPTPPLSPAPPVRVVAFQGRRDQACADRTEARKGRCLDVVDFLTVDTRSPVEGTAVEPVLDDVGALQAQLLEDLAIRWNAPDVQQSIRLDGYTSLPQSSAVWGAWSAPDGTWAGPRPDRMVGVGRWISVDPSPTAPRDPAALFPTVKVLVPPGVHLPAPHVVLDGRFAQRLGHGGRRHDHDVMDADMSTSGPIFEQLFPYAYAGSQRSEDDEVYALRERIPLIAFSRDRRPGAAETVVPARGLDDARRLAHEAFEDFQHAVFSQTAQFAMEDFTANQVRVLAAMAAMSTPPGELEDTAGVARDLVAAARYETDRAADAVATRTAEEAVRLAPIDLDLAAVPRSVLAAWAPRVVRDHRATGALGVDFYADLNERVRDELGILLRVDAAPLPSLDEPERTRWVAASVLPGEDRDVIDAAILRTALTLVFGEVDADQRARVETWMLGDQARRAIAATFDRTKAATPNEVAGAAQVQWQTVLGLHGHAPQPRAQGLGAVDPLAVCTTADGADALAEPAFREIGVELVVAGPDTLSSEDPVPDVLDVAAEKLPWVFLDDPEVAPTVERLLGLGDGRALYRVRWTVWSGWHLLWAVEPTPDGGRRLALRTAALCDDLVIAPRDLVPTLVRGALLAGNLRPSTPERPGDVPRRRIPSPLDSTDDVADRVSGAPAQVESGTAKVDEARAVADAPMDTVSGTKPTFAEDTTEIAFETLSPAAAWLQALVHPRLRAEGEAGRVLVSVFDATAPGEALAADEVVPRTPYVRRAGRDDAGQVRTAAWMLWFSPSRERPILVSPAYRPRPSVASADRIPRWDRRHALDWNLGFGLGGWPFERIRWACGATIDPAYGGPCEGQLPTNGGAIDLQGFATWWAHDEPRVGLDVGLEARLDVRPPGFAPAAVEGAPPVEDPGALPSLPWALRFQGGVVLGLTFAPGPQPLTRERPDAPVWGAPATTGDTRLGRFRFGLRGGLLFGPGYSGAQGAAHAELWTGWSLRSRRGRQAAFTPYHPRLFLGPFARGAYAFPVGEEDSSRQLVLRDSWTVYVGLRLQLRVSKQAKLPEAP
jgi:hypothetical protein